MGLRLLLRGSFDKKPETLAVSCCHFNELERVTACCRRVAHRRFFPARLTLRYDKTDFDEALVASGKSGDGKAFGEALVAAGKHMLPGIGKASGKERKMNKEAYATVHAYFKWRTGGGGGSSAETGGSAAGGNDEADQNAQDELELAGESILPAVVFPKRRRLGIDAEA